MTEPALDDTQNLTCDWENDEDDAHEPCPPPWARLVALDRSNPDIALFESDMVVGRAQLDGNRKVSKFHCRFLKESSGKVIVSNLSKNGTLVNGSVLNNEQHHDLQNGDEVTLGPRGLGIPRYIFHVLDNSLACRNTRADEVAESDPQSDSSKRLKLTKVQDDLKCCICLGVWHDVVTVAPCLHNFCNGCFSEYYKNKRNSRCCCPQCRERVLYVKKNHTLSSMIEYHLQDFPSLKRPSEETSHLDQCAIVGNNYVNIAGSDSGTSNDEHDGDASVEVARCPQCPTSQASPQVGDSFVCGPDTVHLCCIACAMLLPERTNIDVPQKCAGCFQVFCGVYWNSQSTSRSVPSMATCFMEKIIERTVTNIPVGAFCGNIYEQEVTRRHLQEQGLQIHDVIHEWLGKMDRDEIDKPELFPSILQGAFSGLFLCKRCEEIIINHLLYKFRLSVPKTALPADAAGRDDCWYGRFCRTQTHNSAHARRYNHVCEQSSRPRSR